jgi:peptide/nickel transport system ATP-binding protein
MSPDIPVTGDALVFDHVDVVYRVNGRDRRVLTDLNLRIGRGEAYGLVGESGCGKSTAAFAAMRYLAPGGRIGRGRISVGGQDLAALSPAELRDLRSHKVSMVYQDPARALNPSIQIGRQMAEVFEAGVTITPAQARSRAADMLARVRIADTGRVLDAYPHQLSGGMQQRVVIAMALSIDPTLLIMDEPTTALDATVEAEILDLIAALRAEFGTALLFISHNLRVVARICDRMGVLYAGALVEEGPADAIFAAPQHPYTAGLLRSLPRPGLRKDKTRLETIEGFPPPPGTDIAGCIFAPRCPIATERCAQDEPPTVDLGGRSSRCHYPERAAGRIASSLEGEVGPQGRVAGDGAAFSLQTDMLNHAPQPSMLRIADLPLKGGGEIRTGVPILSATNLSKTFPGNLHALNGISLELKAGETLGVVGESGSGKSTLARLIVGLTAPDAGGSVTITGEPAAARARHRPAGQLKSLQMIFQNPAAALNRSQTVRRLIGRSLRLANLFGTAREDRLLALARDVRLTESVLDERPRRLSGGMQQRVAIARAFAGEPAIIVCDEPTSALDVSVQSAILNLLADLQAERNVSYLFISHDLNVVQYLTDRIAVLYLGRLLEIGPTDAIFAGPRHPYSDALLSAGTHGHPRLAGDIPSPTDLPTGCVFQTRCPRKIGSICEELEPELIDAGEGHGIRCHIPAGELA